MTLEGSMEKEIWEALISGNPCRLQTLLDEIYFGLGEEREEKMKCPNCGLEKEVSMRDMIFALLVEAGAKSNMDFRRCDCRPNLSPPEYWKANDLSEEEVENMGELAHKVWKIHNLPEMRDCRTLNYGYHITSDDRIICEADGDFVDITDEVLEAKL